MLSVWHTRGQTFLLWDANTSLPPTAIFEIYRDTVPIESLPQGELVGRAFASAGENYRLWDYLPGARWRIPDSTGGMIEVPEGKAFFVYTPSEPGGTYYAVRLEGADTFWAAGPVEEDTGGITAYLQYQSDTVAIFGHWIPGRGEMGNSSAAGLGFNFAVWFPAGGYQEPAPLVVYLHGGTQNLMALSEYAHLAVPGGLLLTLDDPLETLWNDTLVDQNTFWLGYRRGFDRFRPRLPTADTVMLYTARRVWWEVRWVIEHFPVDTERVSVAGPSMGGMGTLFHSQLRPELWSAALAFVPHLKGLRTLTDSMAVWFIFGTEAQNLPTELGPGVYDLYDATWRATHFSGTESWPFTRIVVGVNDERVPWDSNAVAYYFLDSIGVGFHLFWDERGHFWDEWQGAHWYPSKFLSIRSLTSFRRESWPGVSGSDLWPDSAGRQPDTSEPWGTWGGYVEWSEVVDSPTTWAATLWLSHESPYQNDICPADSATALISPKRCRAFSPGPGDLVNWALLEAGDTVAQGAVQADSAGRVWVPVMLKKSERRLVLWLAQKVNENFGGKFRVWAWGKTLRIEGPPGSEGELLLYSADGRLVWRKSVTPPATLKPGLKSGLYIWRFGRERGKLVLR